MTAEERASQLRIHWRNDEREQGVDWRVLHSHVSAAIRAAVNDALERAALECERADAAGDTALAAAGRLRALKEPTP